MSSFSAPLVQCVVIIYQFCTDKNKQYDIVFGQLGKSFAWLDFNKYDLIQFLNV